MDLVTIVKYKLKVVLFLIFCLYVALLILVVLIIVKHDDSLQLAD